MIPAIYVKYYVSYKNICISMDWFDSFLCILPVRWRTQETWTRVCCLCSASSQVPDSNSETPLLISCPISVLVCYKPLPPLTQYKRQTLMSNRWTYFNDPGLWTMYLIMLSILVWWWSVNWRMQDAWTCIMITKNF